MTATQVRAEVLDREPVGAYHLLTLRAPGVAAVARPGQFVAVAVGGPDTAMLLRRAFTLYTADRSTGAVQVVVAEHGRGTAWLTRVRAGDVVDVIGPLGRPFTLPKHPVPAVLVAGGYGSAPMFGLARELAAARCRVHPCLGAGSADRLFGVAEAAELGEDVTVTTVDGSAGRRGVVTDGLAELIVRTGAGIVYACGPMGMLRAVASIAATSGVGCQVAVEESMACGIGVCMSCVLPIVGADGRSRLLRACVEGPVFDGETVRWGDVDTLPDDLVGAAEMSRH